MTNARQYTNGIYVPLSKALSKLMDEYLEFRQFIDFDKNEASEASKEKFHRACGNFDELFKELTDQGADAFLTTALEERISSFMNFLKSSQRASEPIIKFVFDYSIGIPFSIVPFLPIASTSFNRRVIKEVPTNKWLNFIPRGLTFSFRFFGSGFKGLVEEVIAAPITSREFEERFLTDVSDLKFLVKEVTLGAQTAKIKI